MLHKYFVALLVLLFTVNIHSQSPLKFGIFAGISNPIGDFSDNSITGRLNSDNFMDDGPGFAKFGFTGGVEMTYPLGAPGLGWYSSAAFIYNAFDDGAIKNMYEEGGWNVKSIDAGNWTTIQLASGLNYVTPLSPTLDFLVLGQLALSFVNPPSTTVKYDGYLSSDEYDVGTEKLDLESATSLGFVVGAGLVISKKFNVAVRYIGAGEAEMDATGSDKGSYLEYISGDYYYGDYDHTGTGKLKRSISTVLLTLGMTF